MDDTTTLKMSVATLEKNMATMVGVINNNAEASIRANKRLAKLARQTKFQGALLGFTITWVCILTVDLSYEIHEVATLKNEVDKLKKKGE